MAAASAPTARIYAFPDRAGERARSRADAAAMLSASAPKRVVSGAWYHEEAIREATREPKR